MKEITLTIFGGSGFVGKSIINSFQNNYLTKYRINKINIVSRHAKLKLKSFKSKKIFLYDYDFLLNFGDLPEASDIIIIGAETNDYSNYKKDLKSNSLIDNILKIIDKNYHYADILYLSSGAVYGFQENLEGFKEKDEIGNLSKMTDYKKNYAKSKIYFENKIKYLSSNSRKVVIARCFTFIGQYLPLDKHFVIGNMYDCVFKKKKFEINSEKNIFRSYMDEFDLVEWLFLLIIKSKKKFDIYNIGSDIPISIYELAKKFNEVLGMDFDHRKSNYGNDIYLPNIDKFKNEISPNFNSNLDEIIKYNYDKISKKINKKL